MRALLLAWGAVVAPRGSVAQTSPMPPGDVGGDASPSVAASPVRVEARASRSEVTLGEPFTVDLHVVAPAGSELTFPAGVSTDAVELRTPAPAPSAAPGTHRFDAMVLTLGEVQLPAIEVRYRLADGTRGVAAAAPITLSVRSLLPKDPAQQTLADVRGPVSVGIGRAFWAALAAALLLLVALVWLATRRRRRRAPPSVAVPPLALAPDAEALQAIAALEASSVFARGEYRPGYITLTAIAKRYLERRLDAPVMEMTTGETLAFLRGHPQAGELLAIVRDLSEAADRIKFARAEGLAAEASRHLTAVRTLVARLEERLRPPAVAPDTRVA